MFEHPDEIRNSNVHDQVKFKLKNRAFRYEAGFKLVLYLYLVAIPAINPKSSRNTRHLVQEFNFQ
jgi:hypothetical protein